MKRLILIVLILSTCKIFSFSQDRIFRLHTLVGDTIDKKEKIEFDLFPELKNTDFKYGIIYSVGETKKLNAYTQNDSLIVKQLDAGTIADYQSNIDKLQELYATENQADTISDLKRKILLYDSNNQNNSRANTLKINKEALEKSAYEGRRNLSLRTRALENGLNGQKLMDAQTYGGYGEINFKKK